MAKIQSFNDIFNPDTIPMQQAENIQRIAVGIDMLVGLLAEHWGYELKETQDEYGNTLLRWRPKGAKATNGESETPTGSEA